MSKIRGFWCWKRLLVVFARKRTPPGSLKGLLSDCRDLEVGVRISLLTHSHILSFSVSVLSFFFFFSSTQGVFCFFFFLLSSGVMSRLFLSDKECLKISSWIEKIEEKGKAWRGVLSPVAVQKATEMKLMRHHFCFFFFFFL